MITLYKIDSKGKVRVIKYSTKEDSLIQESGLLDGQLTTNIKVCKGKNTGKSNRTSPSQQAESELQSKVNKKLDQGYTLEMSSAVVPKLPMLALKFEDQNKHLSGKVSIQNKLDGQRSYFDTDLKILISRKGKEINTVPYILEELKQIIEISKNYDCLDLDGELYSEELDFQSIMKYLKKERREDKIKLYVYDIMDATRTYKERRAILEEVFSTYSFKYIKLLEEVIIDYNGISDIEAEHTKAIKLGYEGVMIRSLEGLYKYNHRSKDLLKYKVFDDEKLIIKDIIPCDVHTDQGKLVLEYNGQEFDCSLNGTNEFRRDILINKEEYIGETVEVRYFGLTDKGLPRFAKAISLTYDK